MLQEYFFDPEGNFLMENIYGNYGFLQQGRMESPPLILYDFGLERRFREAYRFDNAQRASYGGYLLQYTLKGCGGYESAGQTRMLWPNSGFFSRMPEDSRYFLPADSTAQEWEFFFLHFDGPAVLPFFETVRALTGPVFSLSPQNPAVRLFFRLFDQCRQQNSPALYETGEFLYRFLTRLLRELESPQKEGSDMVLQAASYFKEHFSTIQGIGEAAAACRVSQEHLTRMFRVETGQTPLQYLMKLRIEHALFLLLNTRDSIEKIAVSCGFLNGNYFAKVFRRYLHCSPEEYRKRNRA